MRILNTKEPDDAIKCIPWYVPTEDEDRLRIAAHIYQRLQTKPEDTLMLVAIERNIARAVVVAHMSDVRRKTVWLYQAQAAPGFRHGQTMFDAVKTWAKGKGAKDIRTGVSEHARALERRWGFKPYKKILRLRLKGVN